MPVRAKRRSRARRRPPRRRGAGLMEAARRIAPAPRAGELLQRRSSPDRPPHRRGAPRSQDTSPPHRGLQEHRAPQPARSPTTRRCAAERRASLPSMHPLRVRGAPDDVGFFNVESKRHGRVRTPPRSPPRFPPTELNGLCFSCICPGHVIAQCDFPARCYNCWKEGHRASNYRLPRQRRGIKCVSSPRFEVGARLGGPLSWTAVEGPRRGTPTSRGLARTPCLVVPSQPQLPWGVLGSGGAARSWWTLSPVHRNLHQHRRRHPHHRLHRRRRLHRPP